MIKFKEEYEKLKSLVLDEGIQVVDQYYVGFCSSGYLVFIDSKMTYKAKLFTLAHETGHICIYGRQGIRRAKKIASEKIAHIRALKILTELDEDLVFEYFKYFKRAKDREIRLRKK